MRTICLILEYDGTGLCGWQRQKNGPTVQEHLEGAIAVMTGVHAEVIGASRTDSGVHALGQVAHFRTDSTIPADGFRLGLNNLLPAAISVVGSHQVAADFHARLDASGKHYRYDLFTRPERSPLHQRTSWHRPVALDVEAMEAAARHLIGERDFAAFRAAGCTAQSTERRITSIRLQRPEPHLLRLEVEGNAFLRHMVRILVGTLVEIGQGAKLAGDIPTILAQRDRSKAGQTAPAHGLTLVRVYY